MAYEVFDGSILQVTFEGLLFGQQVMTTMSYQLISSDPVNGVDAIADVRDGLNTVTTGLYNRYRTMVSESVTNLIQRYQWITPVRYAQEVFIPTNRTGLGSIATATNLAMVVTRRGQLANRRNISNLHIPGVPADMIGDGVLAPDLLVIMNLFAQQSIVSENVGFGSDIIPVAFHKAAPADSAELVSATAQDTLRVVRRRTVGKGS